MAGARSLSTGGVPDFSALPPGREATAQEVERTCGRCHPAPKPDLFPKFHWPHEVDRGFSFLEQGPVPAETPSFSSVVRYYQNRAPESLPTLEKSVPPVSSPSRFERTCYRLVENHLSPAVANVRFVNLSDSDERKLDVVACDMLNGQVLLLNPNEPKAAIRVITQAIPNPAHAEAADLDGDGLKDLIVANLGNPAPTDSRLGSVVWLRQQRDGSFTPTTLVSGLGRVADVQAADFDGDGDLDMVVAEFGWLKVGGVVYLENRTTVAEKPQFVATTLDSRNGAIHVPVADLNGDGRLDFVALISQEHETVVAFLNTGNGQFRSQVVYEAPHPAFGSSGIQLVDLDGDGDRDVLLSNGDSMDSALLRPYHGVQWLENQGAFPFRYHRLTALYGAQRAVAADVDGDGDQDIVAVCFLPGWFYQRFRREMRLDAMILLEQTAPGRFARHSLEAVSCDHASCDLGDFDGDGKLDLVTGNSYIPFGLRPAGDHTGADCLVLRRNLGQVRRGPSSSPPSRLSE
jgi:hypothetical protein